MSSYVGVHVQWVTRCGPAQLIFINNDQFYAQWDMNTAVIPAGGRELVNTLSTVCLAGPV